MNTAGDWLGSDLPPGTRCRYCGATKGLMVTTTTLRWTDRFGRRQRDDARYAVCVNRLACRVRERKGVPT